MRFFDAHCDTIGKVWENQADFTGEDPVAGLHVTLPSLREARVCAQVFASWVWSERYRGRELETALAKVGAVRRLCADFPTDLVLATTAAGLEQECGRSGPDAPNGVPGSAAPRDRSETWGPEDVQERGARTAVIASLEGADPLGAEVANLQLFYDQGVRLITLAWGDNAFCGSVFGSGVGSRRWAPN